MKMRIFMRFLLTLYILFVLFVAGTVILCTWGILDSVHPAYWLDTLYTDSIVQIVVSVISIAVIMLSIALMFSGIRKKKQKTALINATGNGDIAISLSAIEEMSVRYMMDNPSIRSVKATVTNRDNKVRISARLAVTEETNIPETLVALQTGLKAHIELLAGIEVKKIMLLVDKTSQVVKARVE